MKNYLSEYLDGKEPVKISKDIERGEVSKGTKAPFDTFDTCQLIENLNNLSAIPDQCPTCGGGISTIIHADAIAWGCDASAGEHYFRKLKRVSIPIPEPVAEDFTAKCFNGNCPAIVRFRQGRGFCSRCKVHQRVVA